MIGQLRQHQSDAAHAADDVAVRHRRRHARLDRRQPRTSCPTAICSNPAAQDLRSTRRRSLRRDVEHELRPERPDQQLRPGHPRRLGCPSVGLESRRLDSAAARTAVCRWSVTYIAPLVRRLFRRRQPVARAVRPDAVQHRGAAGSAIAGRRRLRRVGSLRRRPGKVRTGRQPRRRLEHVTAAGLSTSTVST